MLGELIRAVGRRPDGRQNLKPPFRHAGGKLWIADVDPTGADSEADPFASALCLYEDDRRLTAAHANEMAISIGGGGRYQHWHSTLLFSTTDGSNPNTNGRRYSFDRSLGLEEWETKRLARSSQRWLKHPKGEWFMQRGGADIPPPVLANLGLTNKCNLRCEICGSQKHLDNTGVRRRHMAYETFEEVADTLFPVLSVVELNSQGDPLLHPDIEKVLSVIEHHRCDAKIQHNGTLLRDSIIDRLLRLYGTISFSLDAVGSKFDEVRRGGVWSKAAPGLERLLRERDPRRLTVGVYPTLTARTIGEALNVANWCAERQIDEIGFHRYVPIQGSFEEAPGDSEYNSVCDQIREWSAKNGDPVRIQFEGELLSGGRVEGRRTEYADLDKAMAVFDSGKLMFPMEGKRRGADPFTSCASPSEYVEIGLDGQIGACCRAQDVPLGHATSVEAFADSWLGRNYDRLRRSLRRGATGAYPLPNCAGCVKFFAPTEAGERQAVDYSVPAQPGEERLEFGLGDAVPIEGIQKEDGNCHIAVFPLGIHGEFELLEDGRRLGPGRSYHDEIRGRGKGRYRIGANSVYFSTSDGTDARRNGRTYLLRRVDWATADLVPVEGVHKEQGFCYTAEMPPGTKGEFELWEDDRKLGPAPSYHAEIREQGQGRYHIGGQSLYFSTSDGTDALENGRSYTLRRLVPATEVDASQTVNTYNLIQR